MWRLEAPQWGRESGGESSGARHTVLSLANATYTPRDGGDTWTHLTSHGALVPHGAGRLPDPPIGKTDVCVTPDDSRDADWVDLGPERMRVLDTACCSRRRKLSMRT